MQVIVRVRGFEAPDALHEHIQRRVHFALSRYGGEVDAHLRRVS
jgi:hypothetical protein